MGASQSKNRNLQFPMPHPMSHPMYPSPYGPQPPYPPYGYGQPMYPPGVVPQAPQFAQNYPPQHPVNFMPQNKRKKSRRTQSERFFGGFPFSASMPQPEGPSRRHLSESYTRPVVPPTSVSHRAPTPFISSRREVEPDDEDDDDYSPPPSASRRRATPRFPSPTPVVPDLSRVMNPLQSANRAAFGPGPPAPPPLSNPLPDPPRDLYELSPYKSVLTLPQTTALLTATYPRQEPLTAGSLTLDPSMKRKKSGIGGILRTFSRKDKKKTAPQKVLFVPVQMPNHDLSSGQQQQQQPLRSGGTITAPNSAGTFSSMNAQPASSSLNTMTTTTTATTPVPPIPSSPPAIRFDQTGKYSMFMNHSPHRVVWDNNTYPTALHLHEALKFIETRPDVAEQIRACERPEDVYPLSATFQKDQRPDWGGIYLRVMKDVMYEKFRQHPDLRTILLSTGTARLIYADADDPYWGAGRDGMGQNQLGKTLAEVRDRLMNETIGVGPL